jgi:hypothetical protein
VQTVYPDELVSTRALLTGKPKTPRPPFWFQNVLNAPLSV